MENHKNRTQRSIITVLSTLISLAVKYHIEYPFDNTNESTGTFPIDFYMHKNVNILDVGCGYGGLLFNMSKDLGPDDVALGMEIRDKVTNFVGEKIKTLRVNSSHTQVIIFNDLLYIV
jgi:tRNA G46 methylase TrmB